MKHESKEAKLLRLLKRFRHLTNHKAAKYFDLTDFRKHFSRLKQQGHKVDSVWLNENGKRWKIYWLCK